MRKYALSMNFLVRRSGKFYVRKNMKELFITFITLAGLVIGITCYNSIMGNGQTDGRKQEIPASEQ